MDLLLQVSFLLPMMASAASNTYFVLTPKPTTIFLGSSSAHFNCIVNLGIPHWRVNGSDQILSIGREITFSSNQNTSGHYSTLIIPAYRENNNSLITCVVRVFAEGMLMQETTTPVLFTLQGLLAAPTNTIISTNNIDTLFITWTAPYSLNVTNTEPDITGYILEITNADTNSVLELSVQSTGYIFQTDDAFEMCTVYKMRLLAENALGRGNYSTTVQAAIHRVPVLKTSTDQFETSSDELYTCTVPCYDALVWYYKTDSEPGVLLLLSNYTVNMRATVNSSLVCNSTETIATRLSYLNLATNNITYTVQCAGVRACLVDFESCRPAICLSNSLQITVTDEETLYPTLFDEATTSSEKAVISESVDRNEQNLSYTTTSCTSFESQMTIIGIGVACGGCMLVLIVLILAMSIVNYNRKTKISTSEGITEGTPGPAADEVIYESPSRVEAHVPMDLNCQEPGSHYSVPLPTDPCTAYGVVKNMHTT